MIAPHATDLGQRGRPARADPNHVLGRGATVRFRSGDTGMRRSTRSGGRSSGWLGTSNGAGTGRRG